jgi:hypothetical protein
VTLSIDLTYQTEPKEALKMIMKTQHIREGMRFIKNNYDKLQALDLLEIAKYINTVNTKR